jgi:hypothetical protein
LNKQATLREKRATIDLSDYPEKLAIYFQVKQTSRWIIGYGPYGGQITTVPVLVGF